VRPFVEQYLSGRHAHRLHHCNPRALSFDPSSAWLAQIGAERLPRHRPLRRPHPQERIQPCASNSRRARDDSKYHLISCGSGAGHSRRSDFPLGELTKEEVLPSRATRIFPVAEKKPEAGTLLRSNGATTSISSTPIPRLRNWGVFVSTGRRHRHRRRLCLFRHCRHTTYKTVGQRKGLGVGSVQPVYVFDRYAGTIALSSAQTKALRTGHIPKLKIC